MRAYVLVFVTAAATACGESVGVGGPFDTEGGSDARPVKPSDASADGAHDGSRPLADAHGGDATDGGTDGRVFATGAEAGGGNPEAGADARGGDATDGGTDGRVFATGPEGGGNPEAGADDGGGPDSGDAEPEQCAIVIAENYDQSCSQGTDCIVAFEEFSCGGCAIGAISASAQLQYEADSTRLPDGCYNAIYPPPFVCCVAGVCQTGSDSVCYPDGSVTGAACAAAGGKCQVGLAPCPAAPASAQDCSLSQGVLRVCCLPAADGG